jgi:hypothetical protein
MWYLINILAYFFLHSLSVFIQYWFSENRPALKFGPDKFNILCYKSCLHWRYILKVRLYTEFLFYYFIYKCCLRASVDTEMCCPKAKCGCQYFIVSFAKVTRYRSFCLIFFGEYIYRHVLLSNAIHLLNKIFFKLNIFVQIMYM